MVSTSAMAFSNSSSLFTFAIAKPSNATSIRFFKSCTVFASLLAAKFFRTRSSGICIQHESHNSILFFINKLASGSLVGYLSSGRILEKLAVWHLAFSATSTKAFLKNLKCFKNRALKPLRLSVAPNFFLSENYIAPKAFPGQHHRMKVFLLAGGAGIEPANHSPRVPRLVCWGVQSL